MAFAETANLAVKLTLGGNFTSQMSKATSSLGKFNKESRGFKAGAQIGTGIKRGAIIAAAGVGVLVTQIGFGLDALIQLESATAQTNAVLKSTKSAAGQSAASIRKLAEQYEGLNATIDDKVIQSGENVLLTFTNIRKKAFEPALRAALDLSVAMHQDLQTSIVQVGKALNDPAKGLTKLQRIGVNFTEAQIKQIKALQKSGDLLGAQKVILKELNTEFGGSFLAGGNTTAAKVAKFGDAIEDLQKSLAGALLPAISNIADSLTVLFQDPATIEGAKKLGEDIGKLFSPANISKGIGLLKEGFGALKAIAGPIADVVGGAIKAFTSLPPEVQKLLVGGFAVNKLTGGLVTNVAGGIIETLTKGLLGGIRAPLVNVSGGVVNVGGGVGGGAGGVAGKAAGALSGLSKVFLVGEAIGLALLVNEVRQGIQDSTTAQAQAISTQTNDWLAHTPSQSDLKTGLAGVEAGIRDIEKDPVGAALISGPALEELRGMRTAITNALATAKTSGDRPLTTGPNGASDKQLAHIERSTTKTNAAIEKIRQNIIPSLGTHIPSKLEVAANAATVAGITAALASKRAGDNTKTAVTTGAMSMSGAAKEAGRNTTSAVHSTAGQIVAGFAANRPIVSVNVNVTATQVTKSVTIQNRYGPAGGSAAQNTRYGGHTIL